MKSNVTLIATAITAAFVLSACGAKHSSTSGPTDSAVAAETDLSKSGCTFSESKTDKKTSLSCKDIKGVNQSKAVTTYINKISASMKEKGRKNNDKLQAKLDAASAKLNELQAKSQPAKTEPTKG